MLALLLPQLLLLLRVFIRLRVAAAVAVAVVVVQARKSMATKRGKRRCS